MSKICTKCLKDKPIEEFYVDRVGEYKNGRTAWCAQCHRESRRLRYQIKKSKIK